MTIETIDDLIEQVKMLRKGRISGETREEYLTRLSNMEAELVNQRQRETMRAYLEREKERKEEEAKRAVFKKEKESFSQELQDLLTKYSVELDVDECYNGSYSLKVQSTENRDLYFYLNG